MPSIEHACYPVHKACCEGAAAARLQARGHAAAQVECSTGVRAKGRHGEGAWLVQVDAGGGSVNVLMRLSMPAYKKHIHLCVHECMGGRGRVQSYPEVGSMRTPYPYL